jgi:carboxylesterase type B
MNISALQAASGGSAFPETTLGDPLPLFYWLPVIDGELIPGQLHTLFATGQFAHVPMLVGHVTNEGSWFANNASSAAEVSSFLRANYPHIKETQLEKINHEYANMAPLPGHAAFFPSASAAYGDATFACPANHMASAVSRFVGAAKAWSYRYNVLDPEIVSGGYGVPHTFETSAVFGPGQAGWAASSYYTINAPIVPVVMGYWASFVRSLNPNTYKQPWSPYWETLGNMSGSQLRLQTNNTAMEVVPDWQARNCTMWRQFASLMEL